MSKMCPIDGCKAQKGMCGHEKAMVAMGVIMVLMVLGYAGFSFLG